jgi:hypothetical protein
MENEIHEITPPKRKYSPRKPKPQAIPEHLMTPPPPNPNVALMEGRVAELVEQRTQAQFHLSRVNQQFQRMQLDLQSAKEEFSRVEQEIQYRMGLINQMRGGQPSQAGSGYANAPTVTLPGVGYFPAANGPATWMPMQPQSPAYQPAAPYPQYPTPFDPRFPVDSVPANNRGLYPDVAGTPEGAISSSAEGIRNEEIRTRGY